MLGVVLPLVPPPPRSRHTQMVWQVILLVVFLWVRCASDFI